MYSIYNKCKSLEEPFGAEELSDEEPRKNAEDEVVADIDTKRGEKRIKGMREDGARYAESAERRAITRESNKWLALAPSPQDTHISRSHERWVPVKQNSSSTRDHLKGAGRASSVKALALSPPQDAAYFGHDREAPSRPGAYDVHGEIGHHHTIINDESFVDVETQGQDTPPQIQATLVNEGEAITAIPFDENKQKEARSWKRLGLLSAAILISATVVVLSIIFTRRPEGGIVASNSPTASPTSSMSPTTSSQPSFAPTTVIFKEALSLITSVSPTSPVNDTRSPQFEALQWLSTEPYHMTLSDDRLVQRFVLATLYFSTNGPEWSFGQSWLSASNECDSWLPVGLQCNDNGMLEFLEIENGRELQGSLPAEVGLLTSLKHVNLGGQALTGSIPPELGQLTLLSSCSIVGNELSRNIPTELGLLEMLTSLNLANNGIVGVMPTELGLLSRLTSLELYQNILQGTIPSEFGQLTSLRNLHLAQNRFVTGTMPSELGLAQQLTGLHLFEMDLAGSIPSELGLLRFLNDWGLSQNSLAGQIPSELGRLSNSRALQLWQNELTGSLPTEIGQLTLVRNLSVRANNLVGTIPSELGMLASLESLGLGDNEFTGSIPALLCVPPLVGAIFIDCGEVDCSPGCCLCN